MTRHHPWFVILVLFCIALPPAARGISQRELLPGDLEAYDRFGWCTATDDSRVVVGAPWGGEGAQEVGAVYMFHRMFPSVAWILAARLAPTDTSSNGAFGRAVALSGDTLLVGSPWDDPNGNASGSVYVYRYDGSWTYTWKLDAADGDDVDIFGWSVAVHDRTALVGAPWDEAHGEKSGSAYLFSRAGTGENWTQIGKLLPNLVTTGDEFGYSVALTDDTAVIGAPFDDEAGTDSGSVYVFYRSGSVWFEQARLTADDADSEDQFGYSVAVSGDRIAVGAPGRTYVGGVYIFERDGSTWNQTRMLFPGFGSGRSFGTSVALDGDRLLVGDPTSDEQGQNAGEAYLYVLANTAWVEAGTLTAEDPQPGDEFGSSLSMEGDYASVGAPYDDQRGDDAGVAYMHMNLVPTDYRVDLLLPDNYFTPGETFQLDAKVAVPGPEYGQMPLAVVLDVAGEYWFWPSWVKYPPDFDVDWVFFFIGEKTVPIIDPFVWPDAGGPVSGLHFYGALLTNSMDGLRSDVDDVEWGFGP